MLEQPEKPTRWRRLAIISLSGFVIGNACATLFLYAIHRPELTAWTGHVAQSTPSAVNDLFLGTVILLLSLYLLRKP